MLGWMLFTRALRLLLDNLGWALRVSLVPYGLMVGIVLAMEAGRSAGTPQAPGDLPPVPDDLQAMPFDPSRLDGTLMIEVLLSLTVSLWVAVAWHRFTLLEEYPQGWLPRLHGNEMLRYLGSFFLIGLVVAGALFVVSIPLGIIVLGLPGLAGLGSSVALFVAMILFYRLAVVLPAAAIGRSMTFSEAFAATKGHAGTVAVLALLTTGFSLALEVPTMIGGDAGLVTDIYQAVVGWIGLMVGVSAITVLYGHLIEGRSVD